jgi:hypothetical protein
LLSAGARHTLAAGFASLFAIGAPMRRSLIACGAVVLLSAAAAAATLEIPLTFTASGGGRRGGVKIASVKIADFDMTAPVAKPAPLSIELGPVNTEAGITMNPDDPSLGESVGRAYRYNPHYPGQGFYADQAYAQQGAKREFYVLIEYLDDFPQGVLRMGYMSAGGEFAGLYNNADGPAFENSGTWKTHQFHVKDAKWDRRPSMTPGKGPASDFWFSPVDDGEETNPGGYVSASVSAQPPSGDWKLPSADGTAPAYVTFDLAGRKRLFMLRKSSPVAPVYDQLWFDANDNRDLTDDTPISAEAAGPSMDFAPLATTVTVEGKPVPYRLSASAYSTTMHFMFEGGGSQTLSDPEHLQVILSPACYYRGEAEIDGTTYTVALGDSNCNGRFNDLPFSRPERGEGDALSFRTIGQRPRFGNVPTQVILNNTIYDVDVREHEGRLLLTENTAGAGEVKLPAGVGVLQLADEVKRRAVLAFDPPATMKILPGDYRLRSYRMEKRDEQGDLWEIQCSGGPATVIVGAGAAPAALKMGEPFTARAHPRRQSMPSSQAGSSGGFWNWFTGSDDAGPASPASSVELEFAMADAGGADVYSLDHVSGSASKIERSKKSATRPKEPQYRITKPDGESVATGGFEYG